MKIIFIISLLAFNIQNTKLYKELFFIEYIQSYENYKDNINLDEKELRDIISDNIKNRLKIYYYSKKNFNFDNNLFERKIFLLKRQYNTDSLNFIAVKTGVPKKIILENLKIDVYVEILLKKIFEDIKVTEKEAKNFYYSHLDDFETDREILLYHIFTVAKPNIIKIKKMLDSKKYSFEDLAYKYSEAPESKNRGFIGWVKPSDLPSYFSLAFKVKKNKYSDIVKSDIGFHIFYVKDIKEFAYKSFDEVKDKIKIKILSEKQQKVLNDFLKSIDK